MARDAGRRHRLVTPRLRLRPATSDDVAVLREHWDRPAVRRYLWDGEPVTHATVEAVIARSEVDFDAAGFGAWILHDARGRFVGYCGMRTTEDAGLPELLFSIEPDRWGRGLATEAAAGVLAHAFGTLGLERVLAGVDGPNHASRRVLEHLGARPTTAPGASPQRGPALELTPERLRAMPP